MEYCNDGPGPTTYREEDINDVVGAGRARLRAVLSSIDMTPALLGKILDNAGSDYGTIVVLLRYFNLPVECLKVMAQKYGDPQHEHLRKCPSSEDTIVDWDEQENISADVMHILATGKYRHARIIAAWSHVTDEKTLEMLSKDEDGMVAYGAREALKKRASKR